MLAGCWKLNLEKESKKEGFHREDNYYKKEETEGKEEKEQEKARVFTNLKRSTIIVYSCF